MSDEQRTILELLRLKATLIQLLQQGHFMAHPQDIIEDLNKILETQKGNK